MALIVAQPHYQEARQYYRAFLTIGNSIPQSTWRALSRLCALRCRRSIGFAHRRIRRHGTIPPLAHLVSVAGLAALPVVRTTLTDHDHSLIVGADSPYSPFRVDSFLKHYMGPQHRWTIVIPRHSPFDVLYGTNVAEPAEFHPAPCDHLFIFAPDGHLAALYDRCAIKKLQAEGVLKPTGLPNAKP